MNSRQIDKQARNAALNLKTIKVGNNTFLFSNLNVGDDTPIHPDTLKVYEGIPLLLVRRLNDHEIVGATHIKGGAGDDNAFRAAMREANEICQRHPELADAEWMVLRNNNN